MGCAEAPPVVIRVGYILFAFTRPFICWHLIEDHNGNAVIKTNFLKGL